jgi:diguanylate cyclase (GGDEF)-like protein/PAS domain S-box-containing protein
MEDGLSRIRKSLSLFQATLFTSLFLFPTYFILSRFHSEAESRQRAILRSWARADFSLLSLNRALRILPFTAFSTGPLSPDEVRLIQGWAIQGQVSLKDLKKSAPLFSRLQRIELEHLEHNFRSFRAILSERKPFPFQKPYSESLSRNPVLENMNLLERRLDLSLTILSLSVRNSRENAENALANVEAKWERIEGAVLLGFMVALLVTVGWNLRKAREDSSSREAQLHALFNAMQDAVIYTDLQGQVLFANPAVEMIFGHSPSGLVGRSATVLYEHGKEFASPEHLSSLPEAGNDPPPLEVVCRRKDGSHFTGECRETMVQNQDGLLQGSVMTVRDITRKKEMTDRLSFEKEKWFVTLSSIGDAVIVTDLEARLEYLNAVAERLTGWNLGEATGKPVKDVFDIINEKTREPAESPVEKSLRLGSVVELANHTVLRSRSGTEYAIEDSASPIRSRTGQIIGCVIVFRDVTEKRDLLHQVTHQANYDALTDLPNRYLFQDRLNHMFSRSRRISRSVALICLDLDNFKKINDSSGHPFGDQVLKEAGRRIRLSIRESDTVARLGGDEFAIIACVDKGNPEPVTSLTRKILEVMGRPFLIDEQELYLSVSAGVALFPEDGDDPTTLIRHADIALYQAKEQGRNNVQFFSPLMNLTVQEKSEMENRLHIALEKNEFRLLYQPIVELESGAVKEVEALVRWHHPRRGVVPPDKFIPLAEESGLIAPIGKWILETACRQASEWLAEGFPPIRVAVNISPRQLVQGNFPGLLEKCLRQSGLSPDSLELELTESVLIQRSEKVEKSLSELNAMGVRLSIDDFGTGYSSMSYLTRFSVSTLKIDGSFVQGLEAHPGNAAVITAILALGEAMSLDVIAEGVEIPEQVRFLKEHRCRRVQGHFFSRPVPASEIPDILNTSFRFPPEVLTEKKNPFRPKDGPDRS